MHNGCSLRFDVICSSRVGKNVHLLGPKDKESGVGIMLNAMTLDAMGWDGMGWDWIRGIVGDKKCEVRCVLN